MIVAFHHEFDREAPVLILPYDEAWPKKFAEERVVLAEVIKKWLTGPIEHSGSTAVPGLAVKPVIDIMAGVESVEASRPAIAILEQCGYCYAPYRADAIHWFCKPSPAFRTHHLHLVPFGSPAWREQLAIRDYLRGHPEVASEYAELKARLAEQFRFGRDAYTDAKAPFVRRIVELALES